MKGIAQRREHAARLLADHGAVAEALVVARDGLRATPPPPDLAQRLAARGTIDHEQAGDRALLDDVLRALEGPREPARREFLVQGAAILVLAGYLATKLLHPFGVRVIASAEYDVAHGASNVHDGREASEWLLPDQSAGFVDLRFRRREVRAVRVLNGSNRPGPDRAVVDYELEVFDGDQLVRTVRGTFGPFQRRPQWQRIALDVKRATRLRFHVRSWAGSGGGLAELSLD
ncbi:MAG: hypothetical protein IPJ34_07240 [Myxococcales bacterium]|nr:hypothetical protein [Myxococcales bacterium]